MIAIIDRITERPRKKCEFHDVFCRGYVEHLEAWMTSQEHCGSCQIEFAYNKMCREELAMGRKR